MFDPYKEIICSLLLLLPLKVFLQYYHYYILPTLSLHPFTHLLLAHFMCLFPVFQMLFYLILWQKAPLSYWAPGSDLFLDFGLFIILPCILSCQSASVLILLETALQRAALLPVSKSTLLNFPISNRRPSQGNVSVINSLTSPHIYPPVFLWKNN